MSGRRQASPAAHGKGRVTRIEGDYAKWMLEDSLINFAILSRGRKAGSDHRGCQTADPVGVAEMKEPAQGADMALLDKCEPACCSPSAMPASNCC